MKFMKPKSGNFCVYLTVFAVIYFISCGGTSSRIDQEAEQGSVYQIHILPVDDWGGTPPTIPMSETKVHDLQYITLHHSGEDWEEGRSANEYLRTLQNWSRSEKMWIDIPYHFMIDLEGGIYAARNPQFPGDTNTEYDPAGHLLTCLIGNYETIKPTEKQLEALINLMAWQCREFGIDPETLKGHKDYANTACPGLNLYHFLENGYLVEEIKKRVGKVKTG